MLGRKTDSKKGLLEVRWQVNFKYHITSVFWICLIPIANNLQCAKK